MDEKTIGIYMTKEEYASTHEGVVKNAEHADSATGSSFADNAVKLGGKEATYYASADSVTTLGGTVNEVLATANGALSVAVAAQGTANAAMPRADIVQEAGTGTDKVMSQKAVTDAVAGCGDMKKAEYVGQTAGVVKHAEVADTAMSSSYAENAATAADATKLGGQEPGYYAKASDAGIGCAEVTLGNDNNLLSTSPGSKIVTFWSNTAANDLNVSSGQLTISRDAPNGILVNVRGIYLIQLMVELKTAFAVDEEFAISIGESESIKWFAGTSILKAGDKVINVMGMASVTAGHKFIPLLPGWKAADGNPQIVGGHFRVARLQNWK